MRTTLMLRALARAAFSSTAAVALVAGLASVPAYAADFSMADEVVAPPMEEPARDWTGLHVGIDLGGQFDFVHSDAGAKNQNVYWATHGKPNWQKIYSSADLGAQNFFISGDLGADYQIPNSNLVVGLFANYDFAPSDGSASHEATSYQTNCPGVPCDYFSYVAGTTTKKKQVGNTVSYGDAWGVGARAGVLVNPKALLYVLGGYGQKQINAESEFYYKYHNHEEFVGGLTGGGWQSGWFVGGGLEAWLGKHTTLGVEYRFAQYKGFSASCSIPDCGQSVGPIGGYDFNWHGFDVGKTNSHTARIRLSYWFNK